MRRDPLKSEWKFLMGFGNILLPYMYRDLGLTFPRILRRKHPERVKDLLFVVCILLAGGSELFG